MQVFLIFLLLLSGCTFPDTSHPIGKWTSKICLDGHEYWQTGFPNGNYYSFATIQNDDGTPKKCK